MQKRLILFLTLMTSFLAMPVPGLAVSFNFTGVVTEIADDYNELEGAIVVGDTFTGKITYDQNAADGEPEDPNNGFYADTSSQYKISGSSNGIHFNPVPAPPPGYTTLVTVVINDGEQGDAVGHMSTYDCSGYTPFVYMRLIFMDSSGTALSSDVRPISYNLDDWAEGAVLEIACLNKDGPFMAGLSIKVELESIEPAEGCFIATAAYGSELDTRIDTLRTFRDLYLMNNSIGKALVKAYYQFSPPIANYISERQWLKKIVRTLLVPVIGLASLFV